MPKYLVQGSYTIEGIKGVLKEGGSGRRQAVEAALKSMGGKLDAIYWAFGETDAYVIADVPDNVTALALSMGIASTGTVGVKTTVLLTADVVGQAGRKSVSFRGAGPQPSAAPRPGARRSRTARRSSGKRGGPGLTGRGSRPARAAARGCLRA